MNLWTIQTYRTSVLLAMIITYAVISGGCTIADTQEPAAAAGVPTPTFSGLYETWPGMNPTRRAAADQYNQTIEAALATPQGQVHTPIPQLQTTISDPLLSPGIHPDCIDGTATSSAIIGTTQNCWTGFVSDTYIFVRAGAAISDVQQGRILVAVFAEDQSGIVEHFFYDTPTMHGAVAVQSYAEPQLTMQASDGTAFVFNLATRTWNTSEHTAVPVFATPDTLPVPTPQATTPPNPANDSEHILFASWRTPRPLPTPFPIATASISPARRIAINKGDLDAQDIYLTQANGTDMVQLTQGPANDRVSDWSPDGTRIVFTSDRDGNGDIYTIRLDGSNLTNLTNHPAHDAGARWAPDGSQIAFTSNRDGTWDIYVMQPDGSAVMRLTETPEREVGVSWTPDSTRLIFTTKTETESIITIMNADGTEVTPLEHGEAATLSPDGTRIAFTDLRDGRNDIYTVNVNGTDLTKVTDSGGVNSSAAWSPDGTQLVFSRTTSVFLHLEYGIYIVNVDGSLLEEIVTTPQSDYIVRWSPDGAYVLFGGRSLQDGHRFAVQLLELETRDYRELSPGWTGIWAP